MERELFQVKTRRERSWEHLRAAEGDDKLRWGLRIFADGLAEDDYRVTHGERGRLCERLAGAIPCPGARGQTALHSGAQQRAARIVSQIRRAGLPRVADAFLDRAVAMAPQLMSHFRRWLSRERALDALVDGWSPAGRLTGLAFADRAGLVDLLQLLAGALYLDLDEGLADELRSAWPRMVAAREAEPRLFDVVAALVGDVGLAEQMRHQAGSNDHGGTRLPSLLDHLLGRVRGTFDRARFDAKRPRDRLALDLERLTLELAGELHRAAGWPAGRALLARRMLAHCLVPRPDVLAGRRDGVRWTDLLDESDACPLRVLPPARRVLTALESEPQLDLAGQYQGAALAAILPHWLELLTDRGLLGTRETDVAAVYLGQRLASHTVQRQVWVSYYDPAVLRHLRDAWFWRRDSPRRACHGAAL